MSGRDGGGNGAGFSRRNAAQCIGCGQGGKVGRGCGLGCHDRRLREKETHGHCQNDHHSQSGSKDRAGSTLRPLATPRITVHAGLPARGASCRPPATP